MTSHASAQRATGSLLLATFTLMTAGCRPCELVNTCELSTSLGPSLDTGVGSEAVESEATSASEDEGQDAGESGDTGSPPSTEHALRLYVDSISPSFDIETFEIFDLDTGDVIPAEMLGDGSAYLDDVGAEFKALVKVPSHAEATLCLLTGAAEESWFNLVLVPLDEPQLAMDAGQDTVIATEDMMLEIPANTLVREDAPNEPITGAFEVALTWIPIPEYPETAECPNGWVKEQNEVTNFTLKHMVMANITMTQEGQELQIIEGGHIDYTIALPPLSVQQNAGKPLDIYRLDEEANWVRVGDVALTTWNDEPAGTSSLDHLSTFSVGSRVAGDAKAVAVFNAEGAPESLVLRTWEDGQSKIDRLHTDAAAPNQGQDPTAPNHCVEIKGGDTIEVRNVGTGYTFYFENDATPGSCSDQDPTIYEPPPAPNPSGGDSGDPCLSGLDCLWGYCGFMTAWPLQTACGECVDDGDCPGPGGCAPGDVSTGTGPTCVTGDLGDPCQSNNACSVDGSTCTEVFSIGMTPFDTCGTCETDMDCDPGSSCHPVVRHRFGGIKFYKDCVGDGTLANGSLCDLAGSGDQACAGLCSTVTIDGLPISVCGECDDDLDCGMGTCPPVAYASLIEALTVNIGPSCVP